VQASNTRGRLRVQMLYDDVINDQDYVGLKRITEDRELRKYNRRAVATKIRVNVPVAHWYEYGQTIFTYLMICLPVS